MEPHYFDLLEIPITATDAEINSAYKKMAHKYHPDKQGGSNDKFIQINKAKEVLLDPIHKSIYINNIISDLLTPNYIIDGRLFIINHPSKTGDGSVENPFREGKYDKRIIRSIIIITPK